MGRLRSRRRFFFGLAVDAALCAAAALVGQKEGPEGGDGPELALELLAEAAAAPASAGNRCKRGHPDNIDTGRLPIIAGAGFSEAAP
jgi:hypothetical protein